MLSLYSRVSFLLRNKILSGQYSPGEQLPTENELVTQFGVSKITIRHALSCLEAERLITRRSGKGTFVAKAIPVSKQFVFTENVRDIVLDAQRYKVKLLSLKTIKVKEARIPRDIQSYFHLSEEDRITRIQRIRTLQSVPIYFTENYVPVPVAEGITEKALSQVPLLMILKNNGIRISSGEIYIEAVPADPDIADTLKCRTYDPLILRRIYYQYRSTEPLEIVINFMRAEYFRYRTNIDVRSFNLLK